jgi:hypothetical protein
VAVIDGIVVLLIVEVIRVEIKGIVHNVKIIIIVRLENTRVSNFFGNFDGF